MARHISSERQGLFAFGTLLVVLGAVLVPVGFLLFASQGERAVQNHDMSGGIPSGFFVFMGGGLLLGIGQSLRHVGRAGVAGSGLTLDPEQAREDLEPHARMAGGLMGDALEEAGFANQAGPAAPEVKVRCRACRELNDEKANFCDACGERL